MRVLVKQTERLGLLVGVILGTVAFGQPNSTVFGRWKLVPQNDMVTIQADSIFSSGRIQQTPAKAGITWRKDTLTLQLTNKTDCLYWLENNGNTLRLLPLQTGKKINKETAFKLTRQLPKGTWAYDWAYRDLEQDSVAGVSYYKALTLLQGRRFQPVTIGIIDTGFDESHPDLSKALWTNSSEIQNNGIDDDKNGYIDDLHGWYYLRNINGQLLEHDQAEAARILSEPDKGYSNSVLKQAQTEYTRQRKRLQTLLNALSDSTQLQLSLQYFYSQVNQQPLTIGLLKSLQTLDTLQNQVKYLLTDIYRGQSISLNAFGERLIQARRRYLHVIQDELAFSYTLQDHQPVSNFSGSGQPVGDVHLDALMHGTHVAGIVAGYPADNQKYQLHNAIQIMNLAAGPSSGDERDEWLAKAIRYAVNKGAKVINISMAKRITAHKQLVDEALQWAEKKDVLVINCAGNDFTNTDSIPYYPISRLSSGKLLTNLIEVGNSTADWNKGLPYYSSNYGAQTVDLFAPGTQIRSTLPRGTYGNLTGTSFSAPLVARIAGLIRAFWPTLSASAVKNLLLQTVRKPTFAVLQPGSEKLVRMDQLCRSGGVLNAYQAITTLLKLN